jgi:methylmalonyl-CoA/ethylmalonyl-CoA epimerase
LGVPNMAEAASFLAGTLGGKPFEGGPGIGYRGGQWEFAAGERLEVIEPVGPPEGFLHRFLERQGPGVHHVTFKVPDLGTACEWARGRGYELVGYSDWNPGWKEAFLHPKQAQGIVVQLAESHPELDSAWGRDWDFPTVPSNPPAPVRIVALHLVARSEQAARRQWQETLTGSCRQEGDRLVFHWPDSPLAIAVRIDAQEPEGPRWIEVAGRPARAGLGSSHPALGVHFVATQAGPPTS